MMWIAFFAAVVSFLAYLAEAVVLVWLHIKPTGYHLARNAVSDYGVGPTKNLFGTYLSFNNIGSLALAIALYSAPGIQPIPLWPIIFLVLLTISRFCLSLFPTDIEGKALTRTGLLHYIFAVFVFGFLYTSIVQLTRLFGTKPDWQSIYPILAALSAMAAPSLMAVAVTLLKPLRNIFGLFERLYITITTLWFIIVSAFLVILLR